MAKLSPNPITREDLNEYLASASDFAFEMSVLRELRAQHLKCSHSGHYQDPVTKKSREFDIRALFQNGRSRVRLAVECKNLRDNCPLLVSMVPRDLDESYHECAHILEPLGGRPNQRFRAGVISVPNSRVYPPNEGVVKNTAQVGRSEKDLSFTSGDSDIYEKWGQALASATDLVANSILESGSDQYQRKDFPLLATVIPVLVVPNERLWAVDYDVNGSQRGEPRQVNRAPCFVGKGYPMDVDSPRNLTLSHLEIVTFDGLFDFINKFLRDPSYLFPHAELQKAEQ